MKKVLITGATGFVGSHLVDLLLTHDDLEIYGTRRWSSSLHNLAHIPEMEKKVTLITCNLLDPSSTFKVIEQIRPNLIFHLAAESFVSPSWETPQVYFQTNVLGTLQLLEAVRKLGLKETRLLIAGSGEQYGMVHEDEVPLNEHSPMRPVSPYAVSKIAQDFLSYQYFLTWGLEVVRTRAFNHEGPRRNRMFALSNFAYQIARMERGLQEPVLQVGNLKAKRNWTDVRDMVKAYYLALEKCQSGEVYLIGSDTIYTIKECLHLLIEMSSLRNTIRVQEVPERLRPAEVPLLIADCTKFRRTTGWQPNISFEQTLRDMLEYWRYYFMNKNYLNPDNLML